ncbi:mucin-17-like [Trachemys scripta elegans]|uniref:mucin-17-like n=1 Tax=Trachemys scripta elegans TaxID=31138 RepID=UPI0015556FE5|nr:mucin-17-like [Trachemys scripta elegans]
MTFVEFTETTLATTTSTRDGTATLNPLETESSTSSSSSPVSESASQASEQTAPIGVSGHGSTAPSNARTEETSSTPSATVTESSLGITSTKGALSPVTSEQNTQEGITSSSNQTTLNDVTATDLSHSSLHSTAETPSTDTEKSALPVSTVILDSSTVAPSATSHFTTNIPPQTEVSQITGTSNTVPNTVPMGSTSSDTTDTESNTPPAFTDKVSSTASVASEVGDKSTAFVGTNPMSHLSTTAETPAEISSNSPATTGFSKETTPPLSTTSTRDGTATLNPLETESSTSSSSSPVSESASQASEQTAPIGVSGHGSTAPSNARTEETSSTPSATVTESSLGITSTKGALSPVTSEQNTQEGITSSSNQTTLNDVTATDLSHSSLHSTAETPSTDTEKSALPVSTVILDSSTVAPSATSHFTTNIPPQTEVSQITGTSNTVPNTVPMGSTSSDTTDTESNTPPAFTDKVSSTASVASEVGDKSTAFVGTNPMSHLSTTAETPAEISSNSPATTGFSKETTPPLSTTSTRDGTATLNPLETESSTSSSSSPVSESASQASEQTAPIGVSGHGSTAPSNARTEETSSTPSATVTESSLGITSTKGALSPVTSEQNTQEGITSSSNQTTLNDVTATDLSHSSLHSTAETPSTDTEKSALPVSTVILDSSTVAPSATSHFTTNIPPQTEVSQITGTSNTVPNTVPMGSTSSDTTDTESNTPPAFTDKVSSTASVASEVGDKSTAFVGTNPMSHLSTTAETPAEISSNSPATTGFSKETTPPLSTTSTRDGTATLNPLETESSTSSSSSPVSESASQASEQTAPIGVSGHGSTAPSNARTEETSSTPSATVTESSLGITSTKGALSPVTSEQNTQEGITSSSNQTTLNDVTATDLSHSSLHSTAETPSTDTEKSALPVSTVILDSSTVAPSATSHFTTNIPPQTEVSQITGTSNTVPNTVPMGSTSSDTTDTESNTPPAFTDKVSSTASVASEVGDKSTAFVGTNPMSHLSTTAETPAEISSNSPATTGFSKETTPPLSTTSTRDGTATLNPLETESSTSSSSSPVSESASQASEQTAPIGVSGHGSTAPSNARTEETSSTPSATVTESSLGITSTKGALSPVTSEQNTQEGITSSSNQTTLNDVTATDLSHSSLHSTAETPSTDTEKSALPVSTVILDSSTVAPSATSHFTTNIPPQTEVSQITGTSNTVPNTVPMGSTSSDTTDTESNTPPAFTDKVSSTASVASEVGDKSTAFVGTNPMSHLSTTAETPAEISSNSPATTGFSKETTPPLSTTSTRDGTATLNPLETESSTSSSSSPVSESASQASEQTAPIGVSGHGSTAPSNARTEETSSTPSATVTESSLGITSTKGALSPVTSEQNTQEGITSSSNQTTLNDVTATDLSHSSLHSTAETPSTDTEKSALPVSTVILDSSTVAPSATSHFTTNIPPQTEVSQITGTSNTVPNTVPMGSTSSDTTDTESNTPPAFTDKVSSTASVASEVGDKSTAFVGTNPMSHLSTTAETPAEISSNSPATTGFSKETTPPLSTTSTRDGTATLNPLETESSTSSSSSPVSESASQASEQTAPIGVSGHGSTAPSNARTEETSSTPSATVTESSLGITSTKGALSPVTSEQNTQEGITSSSNQTTLNDVTATDLSHSSLHSTAETPSTDTEKSALPVSTVILDSSTVAPSATSHFTTNIPPQTEVSQITGTSNTVPNTVPMGSTSSDTTDTESNTPPAFTDKVSSTASVASEVGDKSTAFVGTNPMSHLSTTAETPAEISSNSPATTGFSKETTPPLSTTSTRDGTATLNPLETESSTSSSSSPVSESASQASEQTAPIGVSGHGSTAPSNARTEETSSTPSATVTESSLGITSTKGALSPVTSEQNTQEGITSSSNQTTLNDVTATDLSHSSLHSTAETPSTDTEKSALPVSTVILDSSTVAPSATSHFTTNIPPQTEVSQITGTSNTVPNTVPMGSTSSDTTDTESNTPPAFTDKVSSTASVASEVGDKSTAFVGTNPMSHLSTTAETPAEISSNSPATTGFSKETTPPLSTTSTRDGTATLNPLETESSTSSSSSPVSESASQASEQTAPIGVSGHGSTAPSNARTEETSSTPSATVTESSLGITSTKGALSPVTSEQNTQEGITSSSNQTTLNDVTATDLSHSSLHSTAETPSTDTEKSALPVSTVILDSSTVAPSATSHFTTNIPPQTEVSQITGTSNTVPNTVPMGSTSSDTTDTESNTPPAFTDKVSSTASVASEVGDKSTAFVGTNPMSHLSTTAETPAEISSNSPATTGFSKETTPPLSTTSTRDGTATLNPLETESSTSSSSSPVSESASQASEQTAPIGVSGHGSTAPSNARTEETSSTPSATVTESSLGITSTKGALSPVTSEQNTQEGITSSSNQTTLNDVTATDLSHSSLHSTAETPSTDTEKSALPVSTVILDSSTVAPSATSHFTTNIPPQTEVSQITGTSNTVPNTVPMGSTSSDTTDTESNTPPAFTDKVSSTASVASEVGDKSTAFVGTNPMSHLSTTAETPAEISSNSPATTGFSKETTPPLSTTSTRDGTATLNPLETESSTSSSSSPVSESASQASEQTAPIGVSGHGSTAPSNARTEETSSTPSATVTESSLGITSTKGALSPVTSEQNTQEGITSSSNQTTLNDVTATDLSHSSLHSTAETPSTDTEKSALPVSTVILDSSTVAPSATSHFTTNIPPQTEVSQITGTSNTVPNTVPMGSTSSDTTDTESNTPPAFTDKVSSTASVASEVGDKSTAFVGTNPMSHLSTTAETPAEISSNSPATTGFSKETTPPLSTTSTRDGTATLNPLETESSTSSSSSPVSESASQASEQTAPIGVSGHGSTAPSNARTEETSSTPSATVTESSLGITSTKGALSPVTSEQNTQEGITSSSNQTTLNDVTATDLSHSSLHSTAETPSTDTEKSALPVSTVILDSSTVAPSATSHFTTNIPPQTEVSQITGTSNTVPNTVPMGSTSSDTTDTESNTPPAFTDKVSSTASVASEVGDKSTAFVGTNPMSHLSTTAETPAEISSNSPATTGFSKETTPPLSTTSTRDGTATLNPLETESSTSSSSSPVSESASQASEQTAPIGVSGHGSTAPSNARTEETSSTPSATVTESSLGITSTKGALSPVTSEQNTQEGITSSSNQTTLNDVTATDLSHSSLHSTAETPSTDTEKSALPVSTVILDSSTVAPSATSHFTTNIPPQTEVSQITGTSNTVPNTVPMGSTSSDTTDTESNTPPAFTDKVSSTASVASEVGDKSTAFVGTNPMSHLSTTAETPAEISSNSPATTGFSKETTPPLSTTSTRDGTATLNPLETESSTSSSSSPVSESASQASEQTAPIGVSGHGSTAPSNARTEETSSTPSATVTESSLGITSTKGALSPVTSEQNTQEGITSSSNQTTLNDVTATDLSHSSLHSTAETPSTDTEKSALPVSTVILDSSTVAPSATSHFTTNIPPQTEVSQITGTSNTVPNTVPMGSTSSDTTDTESNTPPAFTDKVSSTASVASEVGDKSTAFVGTNPMSHLSTTAETPAEISSNSPATTGFSKETTPPLSTTSTSDGTATLNPLETESSTNPMTHLSTMAHTPAEISSTTIFSSALTGLGTSFSLTSVTSSESNSISNTVQISTLTDMINASETVTMSSTTPKSVIPITVLNTTISQISSTFSTPNIAVSPPTTATTIISASPTKTSLTSRSTVIVATIVTAGDTSSKNTKPTVRITAPEAGTVSSMTQNTLPQGTCTSLIFSIQLEKVTSEVIQLNWTPQGGTRDSPYTVYLLRDNTVRNKSTTNETRIAFGDLVPGYEYIISVEVLTCAKKINTSKRVRTEAKTFDGKTRITNENFKPEYNNKSSEEFKDFEKKFIGEVSYPGLFK